MDRLVKQGGVRGGFSQAPDTTRFAGTGKGEKGSGPTCGGITF